MSDAPPIKFWFEDDVHPSVNIEPRWDPYAQLEVIPTYTPVDCLTWYERHIRLTPDQRRELEEADQRTEIWIQGRLWRISGTRVAPICGQDYEAHKSGGSPKPLHEIANEYVFHPDRIDNKFTRWGTKNEIMAQEQCEEFLRKHFEQQNAKSVQFEYPGGCVIEGDEWFIASPDGVAVVEWADGHSERILLEFKCPVQIKGLITPYYLCQIQSYMGFLQMDRCIFVRWTPNEMKVEEFDLDRAWFSKMYNRCKRFYFCQILPRLVLKAMGYFEHGISVLPVVAPCPEEQENTPSLKRAHNAHLDDIVEQDTPMLKTEIGDGVLGNMHICSTYKKFKSSTN